MAGKERHSGIELFRILATMAVMMAHYCIGDCAAALNHAAQAGNEVNYWLLLFLQGCSTWSVDGFVLISGYYLCRTGRRTLLKPFMLLAQQSVLSTLRYLFRVIPAGSFTLRGLLGAVIAPQYFVMIYIALYLLSPALNLIVERADRRGWRRLLPVLLLILSVWPTLAEAYFEVRGTNPTHLSPIAFDADLDGQTLANFALMYLLGGFLRTREEKLRRIPLWQLLAALCGLWTLTFLWAVLCEYLPHNGFSSAFTFANPFIVLTAAVLMLLFLRMDFRSRWVNLLAGSCYTCFLMHYPILPLTGVAQAVARPWWQLLAHAALVLTGTYLLLWVAWLIWSLLTGWLVKRLRRLRIFAEFELL